MKYTDLDGSDTLVIPRVCISIGLARMLDNS